MMPTAQFNDRVKTIEQVRTAFAQTLIEQKATKPADREQLFCLMDLMVCGIMTEAQQTEFIRQARDRGLLPPGV